MNNIPEYLIIGYINAHNKYYNQTENNRTPYLEVMHGYAKAINKASDGDISEYDIGNFLSGLCRLNPTITFQQTCAALKLADIEIDYE